MRYATSSSRPFPDRPSLLMRYLAAIGPGSILGLGSTHVDLRWDSTSHRLMKAALPHYAFVPIPFVPDTALSGLTINGAFLDSDDDACKKYRAAFPVRNRFVTTRIKAAAIEDPRKYKSFVDQHYQLPQSGPLVLLGNPAAYLGSRVFQKRNSEESPAMTDLARLLEDCSFSSSFRLVRGNSRDESGSIQIQNESSWEDCLVGAECDDIGLIYLARTKSESGRVVLIIAGAGHSFGTLAGVRICQDYGRNELNQRVHKFLQGGNEPIHLSFRGKWQAPQQPKFPFSPSSPISIDFQHRSATSSLVSELEIRNEEEKFSRLAPDGITLKRETTLLGRYFRDNGPISIFSKIYPQDISDDGTAIDLLTSIFPDSNFIPTPELPQKSLSSHSVNFDGSKDAKTLQVADPDFEQRTESWERAREAEKNVNGFNLFVESHYQVPDGGPLCFIGMPESFLGYQKDIKPFQDFPAPEIARLMHSIGYPNRFRLKTRSESNSIIEDRLRLDVTKTNVENGDEDVGLIYLTRGPGGRDILIVAGSQWLGTLAGVQLMFTERKPAVDRVIQDYIDGRRDRVDIGFRCRRYQRTATGNDTIRSDISLPISHPLVDLKVELLNEPTMSAVYAYPYNSDIVFGELMNTIEQNTDSNKYVELGDKFISMTYSVDSRRLNIECEKVIRIVNSDVELHTYFCSQKTAETLIRLEQTCKLIKASHSRRCTPFLILGPTGVGKEGTAFLVHFYTGANGKFESTNLSALTLSVAESELFGHRKGAFTGAEKHRRGLFISCNNGTAVLNECFAGSSETQKVLQPKLLDVMEYGRMKQVGADIFRQVTESIVFTSNEMPTLESMQSAIDDGRVRPDLIARLDANKFELLPLSERPLEILPAFLWTMKRFISHWQSSDSDTSPTGYEFKIDIEAHALLMLLRCQFHTNFRELATLSRTLAMGMKSRTRLITTQMMVEALRFSHGIRENVNRSQTTGMTVHVSLNIKGSNVETVHHEQVPTIVQIHDNGKKSGASPKATRRKSPATGAAVSISDSKKHPFLTCIRTGVVTSENLYSSIGVEKLDDLIEKLQNEGLDGDVTSSQMIIAAKVEALVTTVGDTIRAFESAERAINRLSKLQFKNPPIQETNISNKWVRSLLCDPLQPFKADTNPLADFWKARASSIGSGNKISDDGARDRILMLVWFLTGYPTKNELENAQRKVSDSLS